VTVELDPFSHEIHADPYAIYRALRDELPAYYSERHDFWALTRFEDVQAAARDWWTYSNAAGVDLDGTGGQYSAGNFLDMDPPVHDQLRAVLRRQFVPKEIGTLEDEVRRESADLLDQLEERGDGDLVLDFAAALPVAMICNLLGVPRADRHAVQEWTRSEITRDCGTPELPEVAMRAVEAMKWYFAELVAERRGMRGDGPDDLLQSIVAALYDGRLATEAEAVDMCLLIVTAGTETTTAMISNSLLALDRQPDQRDLLLAGEVGEAGAVEELLRFESPIQMLARVTKDEVRLHGQVIPVGARLVLVYGAANRDERRWSEPDRLILDRAPQRNLAFGEGIHHCLGAPLARLEGRVALPAFLRRFPEYRVTGEPAYHHKHNARGLSHLPVSFGVPAGAPA
jgi:cytochrome P450